MNARAWYRHPMVWFVWGLPLVAVIASIATLAIAIHTDDPLVAKDTPRVEAGAPQPVLSDTGRAVWSGGKSD